VQQDESAEKMTSIAEHGALAGTQEKKESLPPIEEGAGNSRGVQGLVRSCREEIRKAKAQLELRLATVVRDNKKCFYKYINNKQRAKENLHPL